MEVCAANAFDYSNDQNNLPGNEVFSTADLVKIIAKLIPPGEVPHLHLVCRTWVSLTNSIVKEKLFGKKSFFLIPPLRAFRSASASIDWNQSSLVSSCVSVDQFSPFCGKENLLCHYDNTYLFQSPKDRSQLLVKKGKEVERSISLLGETILDLETKLRPTPLCFAVSEKKAAYISNPEEPELIFLELETGIKLAKGKFLNVPSLYLLPPVKLDNYLILSDYIIDLASDHIQFVEHDVAFVDCTMTVVGSHLFASSKESTRAIFINPENKLEIKWENKSLYYGQTAVYIKEVKANDRFIALLCRSDIKNKSQGSIEKNFKCILFLDAKTGNCVSQFHLNSFTLFVPRVVDTQFQETHDWMLFNYLAPSQFEKAHLVGDLFIYIDNNDLNFWHIPSSTCIKCLPWEKTFQIMDICLSNQILTMLVSKQEEDVLKIGKIQVEISLEK